QGGGAGVGLGHGVSLAGSSALSNPDGPEHGSRGRFITTSSTRRKGHDGAGGPRGPRGDAPMSEGGPEGPRRAKPTDSRRVRCAPFVPVVMNQGGARRRPVRTGRPGRGRGASAGARASGREIGRAHSELQSRENIVCRLLLD